MVTWSCSHSEPVASLVLDRTKVADVRNSQFELQTTCAQGKRLQKELSAMRVSFERLVDFGPGVRQRFHPME